MKRPVQNQPVQRGLEGLVKAGFTIALKRLKHPETWLLTWERNGVSWYTTRRDLQDGGHAVIGWLGARGSGRGGEDRYATQGEPPTGTGA